MITERFNVVSIAPKLGRELAYIDSSRGVFGN